MRQTQITFGRAVHLLCFGWLGLLHTHALVAESFETVERVFWKGSAGDMHSVLERDLEGLSGKEREQRILKYWREFIPANNTSPAADLEQELARIAGESAGHSVDGTESDNGFFVREERTENEARVEALRTWILFSYRDLLPDLIGSRLSDERVSTIDLITIDAVNTAFVDSTTGLQALEFWVELYRESKNPAFRLIAVAKSKHATLESASAPSSESNEWTFATMVSRKRAFEEFAKDPNHFIREFSAETLEVYSRTVRDMAAEHNYSEDDVADRFERRIDRGIFKTTPAPSFGSAGTSDTEHRKEKFSSKTGKDDEANNGNSKLPFIFVAMAVIGGLALLIGALKRLALRRPTND